jgi:hypothetical protein
MAGSSFAVVVMCDRFSHLCADGLASHRFFFWRIWDPSAYEGMHAGLSGRHGLGGGSGLLVLEIERVTGEACQF